MVRGRVWDLDHNNPLHMEWIVDCKIVKWQKLSSKPSSGCKAMCGQKGGSGICITMDDLPRHYSTVSHMIVFAHHSCVCLCLLTVFVFAHSDCVYSHLCCVNLNNRGFTATLLNITQLSLCLLTIVVFCFCLYLS